MLPERRVFDPDVSPQHEVNQQAAEQEGLRYDEQRQAYLDEDGCMVRDQYGQHY